MRKIEAPTSDFKNLSIWQNVPIIHKVCHFQNKHLDIVHIKMILLKTIVRTFPPNNNAPPTTSMIFITTYKVKINQTRSQDKTNTATIFDTPTHQQSKVIILIGDWNLQLDCERSCHSPKWKCQSKRIETFNVWNMEFCIIRLQCK